MFYSSAHEFSHDNVNFDLVIVVDLSFLWKRMGTFNTSLVPMIFTTFYLASTNFQAVFALLQEFAIYGRSKKLSSGKEGVYKVR